MGRKVIQALGDEPRGKTVALLGLDLQAQHRRHARRAVDRASSRRSRMPASRSAATIPKSMEQARPLMPNVELCAEPL